MARTLIFFFIFWLILLISIPLILPVYLLILFKFHGIKRKYVRSVTSGWAQFTLFTAGIRLKKSGIENIHVPHSGYVIISNHQGNFDIPVLIAVLPFTPAFIAKKELKKIPIFRSWMHALECLPIDRTDPGTARENICKRMRQEGKNPLVIFPEGTRSRDEHTGKFKTGSLKLLFHQRLDVLPVTIDGSYKSFEEKKKIQPAEIRISFHPLIRTSSYQPKNFTEFLSDLQRIISGGLR